jgi:hypothetical protein
VGARGMVLSEFQEVSMAVASLGKSSMQDYIFTLRQINKYTISKQTNNDQMIKQNNGLHCRSLKLPKTYT